MVGGIARQAEGLSEELRRRLPANARRSVTSWRLLVATMLHARTANLMALSASLPLEPSGRTCAINGPRASSTTTAHMRRGDAIKRHQEPIQGRH